MMRGAAFGLTASMRLRRLSFFCVDGHRVKPNHRNADLLKQLQDLVLHLGVSTVAVMKVPAHEDIQEYSNDLERWLIMGNITADAAAVGANQARPEAFWNLWSSYVAPVTESRNHAMPVCAHMLAVSKMWKQTVPAATVSQPKPARPVRPSRKQRGCSGLHPRAYSCVTRLFGNFFQLSLPEMYRVGSPASVPRPMDFDGFRTFICT